MPYKCSKCGELITEEQVAKTVEKFGNALCNKCILAGVEDGVEGAPSAPDEEQEQQTHITGGKDNDVPVVEHPESSTAVAEYAAKPIPAVIPELDMDTIKTYLCPAATDQKPLCF